MRQCWDRANIGFAQYQVTESDIGACGSVRIGQRLVLHSIRLPSRISGHAAVLG